MTAPPDIAIVGAKIEIGDGRVIDNGIVVIHGNLISAVGDTASNSAPEGAQIINGKGLTVYPGFVDAYSTSGLKLPTARPSGSTLPDTRNTAPATMWHANRKGIRSDVQASKCLDLKAPYTDQFAQGITSVLLSGGDGSIAGTACFVNLAAAPHVLVPEAATEVVVRGGSGGFGGDEMAGGQRPSATTGAPSYPYPSTPFGTFALTRQTFLDAKFNQALAKPIVDPTYDNLKPLLSGKIPALFTVSSAREIVRATHLADEFGFRMIVNGGNDAYRVIDSLSKYHASVIINLDLPDEPDKKPGDGKDATPARVLEDRWNIWKERQANAKTLDDAHIPLALRGGAGLSGYLAGVRRVVKGGLSRESALKAMTLGAAKIFGVDDRIGSIESGKLANLVIMSGDFLDEKSKVQTVFVEGVKNELKKEGSK